VGSVGVTPALKTAVLQNIEKNLGIMIPKHNGLDTMACLEAAHDGKMDLAFILGGNLFGASPDPVFTEQALDRIPFMRLFKSVKNFKLMGVLSINPTFLR
jgi:predicted molibdopterin-dependent oxidoreductase YjgC